MALTLAKGIQLARWTRCSCCRGANVPGSSPNSSSRGEKTLPTLGAVPIGSAQDHAFSSIALQRPLVGSSRLQSHSTVRTVGTLLDGRVPAPFSTGTVPSRFLLQISFQLHHALVDLFFNFDKGRFGVRSSPCSHVGENLFTLFHPGILLHCHFHHLPAVFDGCILASFHTSAYPFAKTWGTPLLYGIVHRSHAASRWDKGHCRTNHTI